MSRLKTIKGRERRRKRIRAKVSGTSIKPRVSVFRSNRYLSAQIIDDEKGQTLASVSTRETSGKTYMEKAKLAGNNLAKESLKKDIKEVVFDRGGYLYTGKVKALAEGLREGGLKF